jgi:starch synthase (maltosyl-transferring)
VQLPLPEWGLSADASLEVLDLISTERYYWRGEWNYVRLDPQARVGHILHVQVPKLPSQEDSPLPLRG